MYKIITFFFISTLSLVTISQRPLDYEKNQLDFKLNYSSGNPKKGAYTEIDLSKLKFRLYPNSEDQAELRYFTDLYFYVENDFDGTADFIFTMLKPTVSWSIINEDGVSLVKSYLNMFDEEGNNIGIKQYNNNLKVPILKRGEYYIRLFVNAIPTEESLIHIFVGKTYK